MKYPNAFAGVKKLYISEVLALITLICGLITAIAGLSTAGVIEAQGETAANAGLAITGGLAIVTAVLSLVCFILNLVGLRQAGKDEPIFQYALYASLLGIVVSVAAGFLPEGVVKELLSVVNEIMLLLVPLLSIAGIMSLAKQSMNADMEKRGNSLIQLITVSIIVAGVADIVYRFFVNGAIVLGIVAIVVDLIATLIYLGYLNRARKMLAE